MLLVRSLLLVLVLSASAFAQHFTHPLSAGGNRTIPVPAIPAGSTDTISILAVMVQFQPDNDIRTTGDGRFVLSAPAVATIDAPPHDRTYFEQHLTFLANYYLKASKGRTAIRYTVLDSVFTLPSPMMVYSPPKNGSNQSLANLARDTWQKVDSSGLVKDFARYQSFILFHAGVGRDIDLIGTLGYDPGPLDIPSLYIGPSAFENLYGGGIVVQGGAYTITNTIIMPETESRPVPGATGDILLQLSINGLLCASMGNHLGLPDLFNTVTGASGIGRFGLMDGQAIFSFSGLFPPEPSAWEKYWLGWLKPIIVPVGTSALDLPAVALADTVFRVPISDAEYFLLENRSRDPHRSGQTVTSVLNSVTRRQFFGRDTIGFNAGDVSLITGSVTDVDVLDWSLPGGVDAEGTFYDGGVLIWHIDETVINASISNDQVNANPERRGVYVEEADGSQDIGQQYGMFSAGSGSEDGTALDFWYKGNSSPVNANEFSSATHPSSISNLGALSHVTIATFSSRAPRMTASVTRGDALSPLRGYPQQTGESLGAGVLTVAEGLVAPGAILVGTSGVPKAKNTLEGTSPPLPPVGGKLYLLPADSSASTKPFLTSGVIARTTLAERGFNTATAVADLNGEGAPEIIALESATPGAATPSVVRAFALRDANADSLADDIFSRTLPGQCLTPPVLSDSLVAIGNSLGTVYFLHFNGTLGDSIPPPSAAGEVRGISRGSGPNTFLITYAGGIVRRTVRTPSGTQARADLLRNIAGTPSGPCATGVFSSLAAPSQILSALSTTGGRLYLVDSTLADVPGFPVESGESTLGPVVLGDIDGDGSRDLVAFGGRRMFAYSAAGVTLDHFPITVSSTLDNASPLIGDVDGNGQVEIVGVSTDGLAYACTRDGAMAPGFPLAVGTGHQSAALLSANGGILLVTASDDGSISAWRTGRAASTQTAELYPWPQSGRDARHAGIDLMTLPLTSKSSQFFPTERAYNWPNPVYNGKTFIRYFVQENAAVNIKIFDLAGDLVTELNGRGIGGMDNEIPWDVSSIQSGIYFARIEASGEGKNGMTVVKIAVVK